MAEGGGWPVCNFGPKWVSHKKNGARLGLAPRVDETIFKQRRKPAGIVGAQYRLIYPMKLGIFGL